MNNNFEYKVERVKTEKNCSYIILDVNIQGKRITLVNLYGPNQDNPNSYTNIKQKVSEFENDQVIMCGDWNFVLDPDLDCNNYLHINNPKARKVIIEYRSFKKVISLRNISKVFSHFYYTFTIHVIKFSCHFVSINHINV